MAKIFVILTKGKDGVLLKNRNSWDVIINRSMNKTTTGTGMQLTFDYIYQNGVPKL